MNLGSRLFLIAATKLQGTCSGNMKMSNITVSLRKIITYLTQLHLLKKQICYRCLIKTFSENIQASFTDASWKISLLLKTAILKNNQRQLLFYCLFH